MSKDTKPSPGDYTQTAFINSIDARRAKLEMTGGFFQPRGDGLTAHFYMCARPDSTVAVSMCGTSVEKVEDLHDFAEAKRCLTCALYAEAGKEEDQQKKYAARQRHAERVEKIVTERAERKAREKSKRSKGRKAITRSE